jgi:energy-coupling factor transporter ATP-binding protein EcfA2
MMSVEVTISECGPLRESRLVLPERGIVLVIGPNLSGKSMLASSLGALAVAGTLTGETVLLGTLEDRLLGEEGLWADLYRIEARTRERGEVNLLDPLDFLSALPELGSLSKLDELIRARSDQVLNGTRDYLARTVFATEFCLARALSPWCREPGKPTLRVSLTSTVLGGIRAELPAEDPARAGAQALSAASLWGVERVYGLNLSNPVSFVERYVGLLTPTPSALLAKVVTRNLKPQVDPELHLELKGVLARAWAEVSEAEMGIGDFDFAHTPQDEPALVLSGVEKMLPWNYTSSGVVGLTGHWLALSALSVLRYGRGDRVLLASVEEPEAHLDPYAAYLLPRLYAKAAARLGVTFIVATHSEAFVKGVEDAVGEGLLKAESVRVYETVGGGKLFKLRELSVREDGIVEGSRFTKIAKLLLQRKLGLEEGSA